MKIAKDTVVTMHYKVMNAQGQLLDKAQEPTSYLHGGYGNTFPKIEEALEGQAAGFATTIELAPADAFGEYNEALLQTIPKTQFPPGVKVGGTGLPEAEDTSTLEARDGGIRTAEPGQELRRGFREEADAGSPSRPLAICECTLHRT